MKHTYIHTYICKFKIIGKCLLYVEAKRPNNLRTLNDTVINFYRRHQLYFQALVKRVLTATNI